MSRAAGPRRAASSTHRQCGDADRPVLHNIGLCLVISQICIVYLEAGLYKVQGTLWQDGTASTTAAVRRLRCVPAPGRSADPLTLPVVVATYVTVLAQIAFPFLLFHRSPAASDCSCCWGCI